MPKTTLELNVGGNYLTLPEVSLIRLMNQFHRISQESCVQFHGFFDVEAKLCTTVYRLAKVCVQVEKDKDNGDW